MTTWHSDIHKRKKTGGRKKPYRKLKRYERGGEPALTSLGQLKVRIKRGRGGNIKVGLASVNYANVYNPSTGKVEKVEIIDVRSNPSSRDWERRRIITKGAVIVTPLGEATVTSRPGQDGVVNAVLNV